MSWIAALGVALAAVLVAPDALAAAAVRDAPRFELERSKAMLEVEAEPGGRFVLDATAIMDPAAERPLVLAITAAVAQPLGLTACGSTENDLFEDGFEQSAAARAEDGGGKAR